LEGENLQMPRSKKPIALTVLLLLFVTVVVSPVWAEQTGAASAISSARNTILSCYSAAMEAEAAGANITVLTANLNAAGSLLSQAESAYAASDFDSAFNLASQSQNTLTGFIAEANALKENATQQQNRDFLVNVVGSLIGAFAVVVAGFATWRFLKKRYETTEAHVNESSKV
jgi:hypothetical protein